MFPEQRITTSFFQKNPLNIVVSDYTDIGNDPDDGLALSMIDRAIKRGELGPKALKEIVTTLYKPRQKAEIAAKLIPGSSAPIYVGYGSDPKSPDEFNAAYPFWPSVWGTPGYTNAVSLGQGKGFSDLPYDPNRIQEKKSESTSAEATESEVILGLAPYTDIAKYLESGKKVDRIVLMGGYFGKEVDGKIEISRPGYNTAVDPLAAAKVLTQKEHPILIFNSQHITDWKFAWTQDEILAILCSTEKNELGTAVAKDMAHYWSNKKPTPFGSLVMADVLTTYVGILHPELIKSTMPVEFKFNDPFFVIPGTDTKEPIHMMHPQAKTLFTVTKQDSGNVHIVTELAEKPEVLRNKVIEELVTPLFFKEKNSFEKAVQAQKEKPLTNEEITALIQKLYS